VGIDNHFKGLGLHGVYDAKYDRIIISKLDYIPLSGDVKYDETTKEFYIDKDYSGWKTKEVIALTNTEYFCKRSFLYIGK
jgi:hypothetical protein